MEPTTEPAPANEPLATPLLAAHRALGGRIVPFAGWSMPLDYGSILEESRAVRETAGLFDVSHMGRFFLHGPEVGAALDRALGGRIEDLPVEMARYTLILDEGGGILDDLLVYRLGEDDWMLVVNAANRERDAAVLRERLAPLALDDRTRDGGGILALQGPESPRLVAAVAPGAEDLPFLGLGRFDAPWGPLLVARTGYTGERGYELFPTAAQLVPLWERLLELGARPVGLGARDVLRLEAAMPLYGHEIHEGVDPREAGLGFAIRGWKERDFVGGDALRAAGPPRRELVGLTAEKRVPRQGYPVLAGDRVVGEVCSGAWSAALDRPIATALVERGVDGPLAVDLRGKPLPVERVPLPFVPHRSRD